MLKKKSVPAGLLVILFLAVLSCGRAEDPAAGHDEIPIGENISFAEGFAMMLSLDNSYNASYKDEKLNSTMVNVSVIPEMIKDIESMKKRFEVIGSYESIALAKFANIRIGMLDIQAIYQDAVALGPEGTAWDGFRCDDMEELAMTAKLYNKTKIMFHDVMLNQMDNFLVEYPEYRQYVGIGRNKTRFYYSDIRALNQISEENRIAIRTIREICPE